MARSIGSFGCQRTSALCYPRCLEVIRTVLFDPTTCLEPDQPRYPFKDENIIVYADQPFIPSNLLYPCFHLYLLLLNSNLLDKPSTEGRQVSCVIDG